MTTPPAPANTASIYVRLSREAAEENLSREGMVDDCKALAAREGLEVIAVHVDDGISGAVRNRPAFLAWLADGTEGRADTLVAWHTDRLTREGVNVAALILDTVEGKNATTGRKERPPVRLMDTKGLDSRGDETAFRFRFVIAAEVARAERDRMADRSRAATRRAMASGRWSGGDPPIGFEVIDNPAGPGRVLDLHPAEATFVREAARRVLAGDTFASVLRFANSAEGVRPRRAKLWGWRSLVQVLTGHPAAGRVVRRVNGSRTEVEDVRDETGAPVRIPAILTPDESAALRAILTGTRDPRKQGGRKASRLLSGLLFCAGCGHRLTIARPAKDAPVYRCQIGKTTGCTSPVSVRCEIAERHVEGVFLAALGDCPHVVREVSVAGAAEVEAAEQAVTEALMEVGRSATREAVARLVEAQARREAAATLPQDAEVRLVPSGLTIRERWEAADVEDRRAMLAANVATISLRRNPGGKGGRGRAFQPDRFVIVWTPAWPDTEGGDGLPSGRAVVEVED